MLVSWRIVVPSSTGSRSGDPLPARCWMPGMAESPTFRTTWLNSCRFTELAREPSGYCRRPGCVEASTGDVGTANGEW